MVRVQVGQQHAARNHLIVKDDLTVVAGIDLAQLIVRRLHSLYARIDPTVKWESSIVQTGTIPHANYLCRMRL